jgi:hypothetical protein
MSSAGDDWRLTNQDLYLAGATLYWKQWARPGEEWDHDHCAFCWAKFMEEDRPGVLHEGYVTADGRHWICRGCFDDFRERFGWKVEPSS